MKVLWLSSVPVNKYTKAFGYTEVSSGSWISALFDNLVNMGNIEFAVCFPSKKKQSTKLEGVQYYTFKYNKTTYKRSIEDTFVDILKEFNPEIIHIWGTEQVYALAMVKASERLNIADRLVVNLQGLCNAISKHYYAGLNYKVILGYTLRDIVSGNIRRKKKQFQKRGKYENELLRRVKYVIGRTDWDKSFALSINPNLIYFHCNEVLRDVFYSGKWSIGSCVRHTIFVSQCNYPIKGFHFLLEAMPQIVLKYPDAHLYVAGTDVTRRNGNFIEKFKLTYYGKHILKLINKYGLNNNITFTGNLSAEQMHAQFLSSHVFVSCSSVENESNSLSEAKILGVPSIVSYVGGITDRIQNKIDGFAYPYDEPTMLAYYVKELFQNDAKAIEFSLVSQKEANTLFDREKNTSTMYKIYQKIIDYSSYI